MHTTGAIVFGFLLGLLVAALVMIGTLMRYVSSDMETFRRWLDAA